MEFYNQKLVELIVSRAMLEYALLRLDDKELTTKELATKYATEIIKELK